MSETVQVDLPANQVLNLVSHLELPPGPAGETMIQVREANGRFINWAFREVTRPPLSNDIGHTLFEGNSITVVPRAAVGGRVVIGLYVWSAYPAVLMVTQT